MSTKEYILQPQPTPITSAEFRHVWAFDLGKGSIGEAVRVGMEFKHTASLLIPAEFAETKTARTRRRMWRTRQAHLARERWLREVFCAAGLESAVLRLFFPLPDTIFPPDRHGANQ